MDKIDHRTSPCGRCPWRRDTDLADFTEADFTKLVGASGEPGAEAALDAPLLACHLDQPGTARAMRKCAGWLAVAGPDHLGVRLLVISGALPSEALAPRQGWPELYDSLTEMLVHRPADAVSGQDRR